MSLIHRIFERKGKAQNSQKDILNTVESTVPKEQTPKAQDPGHPAGPILEKEKALEKTAQLNQRAERLCNQEHSGEALDLAQKALSVLEKSYGENGPEVASQLVFLARLYVACGDKVNEALQTKLVVVTVKVDKQELGKTYEGQLMLNRIEKYPDGGGGEGDDQGITMAEWTFLWMCAQAVPLYERALSIVEKDRDTVHPIFLDVVDQLGSLYDFFYLYDRAQPLLKIALEIKEKTLGSENPEVAILAEKLASLCQNLGDFSEAISLFEKALAIKEQFFGPEHGEVAICLINLAGLYQEVADHAKARRLYKRVLLISENCSINCSQGLLSTVDSMIVQGQTAEAERFLEEFVSDMPPDWKPVTELSDSVKIAYWDAAEFLWYAVNGTPGGGHKKFEWVPPSYSKAFYLLAFMAVEREDWLGAMTYIDQALRLEPDHPLLLCEKAMILSHTDHHEEAYDLFVKAANIRPAAPPDQRARALRGAAIALIDLRRLDEAEEMLKKSLKLEPENEIATNELVHIQALRCGGPPIDKCTLNSRTSSCFLRLRPLGRFGNR